MGFGTCVSALNWWPILKMLGMIFGFVFLAGIVVIGISLYCFYKYWNDSWPKMSP